MEIINLKWTDEEHIPIKPKCCDVPFFFPRSEFETTFAGGLQKYFNGWHECGERLHISMTI